MLASYGVIKGDGGTWATCPMLLRGIWAQSRRAGLCCWSWLSAHTEAQPEWGRRDHAPSPEKTC